MLTEALPLDRQEHQAVAGVCVLAAFADGAQSDAERARIEQIVSRFAGEAMDLPGIYQDALGGRFTLATAAGQLQTPAGRALAYEMAVCVCNADGPPSDSENKFLADLHQALALQPPETGAHQQTAQALAAPPIIGEALPADANREKELEQVILNAAILSGGLEMMPHTLATMAIVPVQMRMVYRIGQAYGFQLDGGHAKDFLATVGIGLTSQVFEGFARQLIGGFARRFTGGLIGGLAGEAAGSAIAFATTYALGQAAKKYYASGRSLSPSQLKEVFSSMLANGRSLQGNYAGEMAQRSRQMNVTDLLALTKQT
jgi:uncharacterized protein (DUF697 family)/tellurite resistance protein